MARSRRTRRAVLGVGGGILLTALLVAYRTVESSSGDYYPDWAPDGGSVAFERINLLSRQVWIASENGGIQEQVTTDGSNGTPAWSPAGDQIAFESKRDGNREIYLVDLGSGDETNLTAHESDDWGPPAWSPDGRKLVFASDRDGTVDLYVMDVATRGVEVLVASDSSDWYPSWSPDGQWISFESRRSGDQEIYVVPSSGGPVRRVTSRIGPDHDATWTSKGGLIFDSWGRPDGGLFERGSLDVEERSLVSGALSGTRSRGGVLAFVKKVDGHYRIHLRDADGTVILPRK